jgi:predicted metal-dependent enzyme (double-stranded beta helix superfamily)
MVTRQSHNDASLSEIDWDEVLTPPQELAAATRELIPAASSLSAVELEQVAIAIRDRPELWEPLLVVDARRRRYRLLYEDERTDIWVLCWMPGQSTGFHDHDVSDVGIAIAQGMIVERQLRLPTGATALELRLGDTRQGPAGYIHSVAHGEGAPAVSIHCYSPPLMKVGQYRVDPEGVLRRDAEHGRRELVDETIARVAPELV